MAWRDALKIISPKFAKAKAIAKLAGLAVSARVKSNFRKWNRKQYGKRDDGK